MEMFKLLQQKADWIRLETLKLHLLCPETRIASSLSCIEILTVLYYGKIVKFDSKNIFAEDRDRFIISKGHGSIGMYTILADLGFFKKNELQKIGKEGSFLGGIPDPIIPGYETINGSLGHGLGVACGIALALKQKKLTSKVFILVGDGELYEGSMWEAIMFASHHKLDNLILIVDNNKVSMLDFCRNIIDIEPLEEKFKVFNWEVFRVEGHNCQKLHKLLTKVKKSHGRRPNVIIADTIKGKGVPRLENDPLSHIKTLKKDEVELLLKGSE